MKFGDLPFILQVAYIGFGFLELVVVAWAGHKLGIWRFIDRCGRAFREGAEQAAAKRDRTWLC